jgi:hypothetical protein
MGEGLAKTVGKMGGVEGLLGGLGAAAGVAGTVFSFAEAARQRRLQFQAEKKAAEALQEAKRQINVNPFEALAINKQPYEFQREALLASGAQATEAGAESERGVAATAGRVQFAQNEAQQGIQTAMSKEMTDLDKLAAEEEANIKRDLASISLAETEGYQAQAKAAQEARVKSIEGGMKSATSAVKGAVQTFVPLYLRNKGIDPATGLPIQSESGSVDRTAEMSNVNRGMDGMGAILAAAKQAALLSTPEGKKLFEANPFIIR